MVIGSPGAYPANVRNKFGLYYDEDEDGSYGPVGSQQLTDYHYNSSSSIGYISGSWWDRDPANSQGIFVGIGVITDTDDGSQARIEQDYHYHNNADHGICISSSFKSSGNSSRYPGLFMDNVLIYTDDWNDLCSRLSKN